MPGPRREISTLYIPYIVTVMLSKRKKIAGLLVLRRRKQRKSRKGKLWSRSWLQRLRCRDCGQYHKLCRMPRAVNRRQAFICQLGLLRLTPEQFYQLKQDVTPFVQRKNTTFSGCVSPGERLMITLRYLATCIYATFLLVEQWSVRWAALWMCSHRSANCTIGTWNA